MRGWLVEASDAVVSVFFPAGCRICDKLLVRASRVPFCEECLASFEAPLEKKCEVCGQSLAWMAVREGEPLVCRACQQKTYAFKRARSFGIYDGALVRAILILKWERMEPLGGGGSRIGLPKWLAGKKIGWRRMWSCQSPCTGTVNGSAGTIKQGLFPSRWRGGWVCLIRRSC